MANTNTWNCCNWRMVINVFFMSCVQIECVLKTSIKMQSSNLLKMSVGYDIPKRLSNCYISGKISYLRNSAFPNLWVATPTGEA